ncbi:hypothetical protein PG984_009876 [Apiospora sp. TS-2023a]
MFTRSYGLSVSNGITVTATTRTITETAYDTGCPTPEWTTTAACIIRGQQRTAAMPKQTQAPARTVASGALLNITRPAFHLKARNEEEWQHDNDCPGQEMDTIIYLVDNYEQEDAQQLFNRLIYDGEEFGIHFDFFQMPESSLEPILFIHVWLMPKSLREKVAQMAGVAVVEGYRGPETHGSSPAERSSRVERWKEAPSNGTSEIGARAEAEPVKDDDHIWWRSQISSYPGESWEYEGTDGGDPEALLYYEYFHDDTLGQDQVVYIIEEDVDISDPEFADADILFISDDSDISRHQPSDEHGTLVAKLLIGRTIGLVPKVTMVAFDSFSLYHESDPAEKFLIAILKVVKDVESRGAQGKCVINMSWQVGDTVAWEYYGREMFKLLTYLEQILDCVLVTSAGNKDPEYPDMKSDDVYPRLFKYTGELPNMLVVGASSKSAYRSKSSLIWSNGRDDDIVYAPGLRMAIPVTGGGYLKLTTGTSISAPLVTSIVLYLRGLESKWKEDFKTPEHVVKMVKYLTRKVNVVAESDDISDADEDPNVQPRIIWNGQVQKENCLLGYSSDMAKEVCDDYVKDIPDNLDDWNPVEVPDACEISGAFKRAINGQSICEGGGKGGNGFTW